VDVGELPVGASVGFNCTLTVPQKGAKPRYMFSYDLCFEDAKSRFKAIGTPFRFILRVELKNSNKSLESVYVRPDEQKFKAELARSIHKYSKSILRPRSVNMPA
jgi:hypothetical protein